MAGIMVRFHISNFVACLSLVVTDHLLRYELSICSYVVPLATKETHTEMDFSIYLLLLDAQICFKARGFVGLRVRHR